MTPAILEDVETFASDWNRASGLDVGPRPLFVELDLTLVHGGP